MNQDYKLFLSVKKTYHPVIYSLADGVKWWKDANTLFMYVGTGEKIRGKNDYFLYLVYAVRKHSSY